MAEMDEQFSNFTLNGTSFVPFCTGAKPPKLLKLTTLSVLMIISLVGNLLIVAVFYKNKSLRTSVHYFIVNVAISDLIIPVIVLPQLIVRAYNDGVLTENRVLASILCQLEFVAWGVFAVVSILSMVMTAFDGFHAVMFALRPALFNRKACLKTIVVIWVSSEAFHVGCLNGLVKGNPGIPCAIMLRTGVKLVKRQLISVIILMCLIFLSAIVLTLLYISISISLYQQKINIHLASEKMQQKSRENRIITCMLVVIVAVFYAGWFTFIYVFTTYILRGLNVISSSCFCWIVLLVLPLMQPVLNPVIYCVLNEDFRQGIRNLLCCQWPHSNKYTRSYHPSLLP